jgi:hypothetical protein
MLETTSSPFTHPKNIVFGAGRVIYVDGHGIEPSGWRLPGGQFTDDAAEAERVARLIDQITVDNAGRIVGRA